MENLSGGKIFKEKVNGQMIIRVCLPLDESLYIDIKNLIRQYAAETFEFIFDLRCLSNIVDLDNLIRHSGLDCLDQITVAVSTQNLKYYLDGRLKKATTLLSSEFEQKIQELKNQVMDKPLTPEKALVVVD